MIFNKFIFIVFLFLNFYIFLQELPQPKNNQLYTEFISYRYASYLKKPLIGSGYIAKNGENKFVFKQVKPFIIEIKKMNNKLTFKRGVSESVEINDMENELFFLFEESEKINQIYNINKKKTKNKDYYYLIPKKDQNISQIIIIGIEDKFEKIEIYFNDNSKIIYEFKNTVTGLQPDEKYF